jgi:nitrite reductase (NO-forming)
MVSLDPRGSPTRVRAVRLDRNADRRVTVTGLALASGFVAAALLAAAVLLASGTTASPASPGWWLPLHLLMAGAAGTAIAAVMPFFSAALVAAPPAAVPVRAGAVGLIALGAALVATRAIAPAGPLPVAGGIAFLAGALLLAWATMAPLRRALGTSRPLVVLAYGVALADVLAGAALATLFVAGWLPIVGRWAVLKPAHAWLNLLGFLALVIAGTLLHLLPTVLGGRIVPRASAAVAIGGLSLGAPLVAIGLLLAGDGGQAADLLVRAGALCSLAGAWALAWHAVEVVRARGRWTTDAGWHLMATGGLVAATGWFAVAMVGAAGRVLLAGPVPAAWRLEEVLAPLAVGWVLQTLVAGWTHLLPSIGPGGPPEHARQRMRLGQGATARLAALNAGTALLAIGIPTATGLVTAAGGTLVVVAVVVSLALVGGAIGEVRQMPAAAKR